MSSPSGIDLEIGSQDLSPLDTPPPLSSSLPDPTWESCEVCEITPTGKPFAKWLGATACKACESFFVRHNVELKLSCKTRGACKITPKTRKSCALCRFIKCWNLGMRRKKGLEEFSIEHYQEWQVQVPSVLSCSRAIIDTVEHDHNYSLASVPVSWIERRESSVDSGIASQHESGAESEESDTIDPCPSKSSDEHASTTGTKRYEQITEQIISAHEDHCDYTEPKMKVLEPKPFTVIDQLDDLYTNRIKAWCTYSHEIATDIHQTATFLGKVPRLDEMVSDHRMILLKNHYFMIYLIKVASGLYSQGLLLPDGRLVDFKTLQILYGPGLAEKMVNFAEDFFESEFTDADIAFMVPIIFCQGSGKLSDLRNFYRLIGLSTETYMKFQGLMPKLTEMNWMHHEVIGFLQKNVQVLNLPALFMDVFGINQ